MFCGFECTCIITITLGAYSYSSERIGSYLHSVLPAFRGLDRKLSIGAKGVNWGTEGYRLENGKSHIIEYKKKTYLICLKGLNYVNSQLEHDHRFQKDPKGFRKGCQYVQVT